MVMIFDSIFNWLSMLMFVMKTDIKHQYKSGNNCYKLNQALTNRSFTVQFRNQIAAGQRWTGTARKDRKGGDTFVLSGSETAFHQYFEQNKTFRNITTFNLNRDFDSGGRLFVKQSLAFFNRDLTTQNYAFKGSQFNSFTDISYAKAYGKHAVVFGGSAVYDQFREKTPNILVPRNETRTYVGAFIQDTVDLTETFLNSIILERLYVNT